MQEAGIEDVNVLYDADDFHVDEALPVTMPTVCKNPSISITLRLQDEKFDLEPVFHKPVRRRFCISGIMFVGIVFERLRSFSSGVSLAVATCTVFPLP